MAELISHRLEVALLNHPRALGINGDLRETWKDVVESHHRGEELSLLAACPPCQGMSTNNSDRGKENDPDAGTQDQRNLLVEIIVNVAQALRPKAIVVENVPAFLTRLVRHPETKIPISAASWLIDELKSTYTVFPILANLKHFGVPQSRTRSFLTFIREDLPALQWLREHNLTPYPKPSHDPNYKGAEPINLQAALEQFGLPSLDARYSHTAQSTENFINSELHFVPVWEDHRYPMVSAIPPNSGKSAWENDTCFACGELANDPNIAVCSNCGHPLARPIVKEADGYYRLVKGYKSTSYRRMSPDLPAATITTASGHIGSSRTIHPFENRLFSPLECALIQTIPKEFNWGSSLEVVGHTNVRAMIGEAVPPHFTNLHGRVLAGILRGENHIDLLPFEDKRCKKARKKLNL